MIRIAAVADLHCTLDDAGKIAARLRGINDDADMLLLPGDLTEHGSLDEARLLVEELSDLRVPILAVLGNHDFASRCTPELCGVLGSGGINVMDGHTAGYTIGGTTLGVVGVRGYRGGFGENELTETAEPETEVWVRTTEEEAAKLERGLRNLQTRYRVVMTHYSPVRETVVGVHPETYAFYGSSRLCEPIDRLGADMVLHGHAHKGTHRGATAAGIPVYNVSAKVIGIPYIVLELDG